MSSRRNILGLLALTGIGVSLAIIQGKRTTQPTGITDWPEHGKIVHTHNGVPIYSNGTQVFKSSGKHTTEDGYYYGRKWQCVEFIKLYYHDAHDHHMPNVWGSPKTSIRKTSAMDHSIKAEECSCSTMKATLHPWSMTC
ncbi:MAG: hypothetical protein ABGY95_05115 [Rubritalea sp.]|uniref:hypothetical protein n=1 Tax=Rubritalea sp. TaxID=2109375 RepID=UPI0032428359